ncbi:MAG: PadR family transcriptional regulator [Gemmatimonadota bacterium]|nr:PadR family transcriptional regulator [Gemmatimonadota bacterium]
MNDPHGGLRAAVFEILLLLCEEDRHGYGLMQEMATRSAGRWILGPGTMYRTLKEMREAGWIERSPAVARAGETDTRRRMYTITDRGRRVAADEATRMSALVERARDERLIPPAGAA